MKLFSPGQTSTWVF